MAEGGRLLKLRHRNRSIVQSCREVAFGAAEHRHRVAGHRFHGR